MNRWLSVLSVIAALALLVVGPAAAQETGRTAWRVESAAPYWETGDPAPNQIFTLPDGRHVAFTGPDDGACPAQLVVRDVAAGEDVCLELPREIERIRRVESAFQSAAWSPDGGRAAVVGLPYMYFRDTDLWIVDVSAGTMAPLVDDGVVGTVMPGQIPAGMIIDAQPAWSPDGTRLAVERSTFGEGEYPTTTLTLIDAASGAAVDLGLLPGHESYDVNFGNTLSLAWSPDGTTLALSTRHAEIEPDYDGLWLVDAASGEMTRPVSVEDIITAADAQLDPDFDATYWFPLAWSPDGARLLMWLNNPRTQTVRLFVVSAADGTLSPVILPGEGANEPIQAIWTPDGQLLISARQETLPPGETMTPLDPEADMSGIAAALVLYDPDSGESALLGHLPFVPLTADLAAWGPENDVLIGGYHLVMAAE